MRETVLQGFTVPPPNAVGTVEELAPSTNNVARTLVANLTTAQIFVTEVRISTRNRSPITVLLGVGPDLGAGGTAEWLDSQRAGSPTSLVRSSLATALLTVSTTPFGEYQVIGSLVLPIYTKINTLESFVVQRRSTGSLRTTFFWFEP